ncbi:glycoside hydrolase family 13 protein [Saliphagus infecundisoli]|uniref:Alpha-glucosidase n=1 Tax=Saliphagus infecundisoli TaxID=1849069 RepID=A0ABD5QH78_9EURY|nr:alpha-glucosidase [Saliphagus infecundisoli]
MSRRNAGGDDDHPWWKEAVVYQVYPKSFNDSDGDGIGDLAGLARRADYLDDLGVDAVWLCPVYGSPMADNGYDISDYRSIHPAYGDMDDWRQVRDVLHERDIRLVMDLVVNHTSDEHEWFRRSRREEDGYADYYHWWEGEPDEPPNNWESIFGGPAWSYDEARGEWYLHLFDEKQPDLNWRNSAVREDVHGMMQWWLDEGVDGFRMDVINLISKTEGLPDGDPEAGLTGAEHFMNGPRVHDRLREMHDRVLDDRDLLVVGETPGASVADAREYVGPNGDGLSMVFQFEHVTVDHGDDKWTTADVPLAEFKEIIAKWQAGLADEGWNSVYLSNHDQPRMVSRFGDDGEYRRKSAKLLGTLTHTLQGTPFVYQGEEIGMTNAPFESPDELRDVEAKNYVERAVEHGEADCYEDVRETVEATARDNARTPMQWSDDTHAGFTDGEPWIECNPNYAEVNVERARSDPDSVLSYYRELIALRHERDLLVYGEFELLAPDDPDVFAYSRRLDGERGLIVLNVAADATSFDVPAEVDRDGLELVIANADDAPATVPATLDLDPYEARVYLTPSQEGGVGR